MVWRGLTATVHEVRVLGVWDPKKSCKYPWNTRIVPIHIPGMQSHLPTCIMRSHKLKEGLGKHRSS